MSTPAVYAALRARFCAPEWALFFEVSNGTGHHGHGYADAVAMNLYPSRGMEVNGFEVKVSRGDWLRELRDPAKAEGVFKYCDRWWLVIAGKDVAKIDELPVTWGMLELVGVKLVIRKQAPELTPQPLDRPFFAALARRASAASNEEIEAIVAARVKDDLDRNRPYKEQALERARTELADLKKEVFAFEQASGITIQQRWDRKPDQIGAALKFVLDGGLRSIDSTLEMMERHASGMLTTLQAVRATPELAQPREVAL